MSSHSSHHAQEVLLVQFSLYVHKKARFISLHLQCDVLAFVLRFFLIKNFSSFFLFHLLFNNSNLIRILKKLVPIPIPGIRIRSNSGSIPELNPGLFATKKKVLSKFFQSNHCLSIVNESKQIGKK